LRQFFSVLFRRKIVVFGAVIIFLLFFMAIFAPWIAPHDPYKQNLSHALEQPSSTYLLGTDHLGRDILSRIIYGARVSLLVGFVSVGIAAVIGMALGLISGYFGKFIDALIMRFIDALMSVPPIMLALALGAALGGGLKNVMISLAISLVPTYARLMRGQVLSIKQNDYIMASEVVGCSSLRIMLRHVLPNCLSPLIVLMTMNVGVAILAEASLSFLGLGIAPPGAAWGAMVNDGYRFLLTNPLLSFAPGLWIMLVVLAYNIVGDGLRDTLDPRLRGTI
jgi:ABC-type dipeptide/oligopeptide/nickel transport system permease subunit